MNPRTAPGVRQVPASIGANPPHVAQRPLRALLSFALLVAAVVLAMPSGAGAGPIKAKSDYGWLAGDLHVHTYWSHDVCETPTTRHDGTECGDEFYTWGFSPAEQIANAESRGLDYIALTDHNTVEHQTDPGYHSSRLTLIPAYENSLHGHAQMLGAHRVYDSGNDEAPAVNAMIDALHADRGLFQINHPMDPTWGYGPEVSNFDTIEVWNLPWANQRDLEGDGLVASNNPEALEFWNAWLDTGKHVAATGGSDSHWRLTFPIQGVGQPTTWIYSSGTTVRQILNGLRLGRTFVSANPPTQAPTLVYLEADANRNGIYETMVGGTVPPASSFRVRVRNGFGQVLQLVTTGGESLEQVTITSNDFAHTFAAEAGSTWVRAEVYVEDLADAREASDLLCLPATLPQDERPRCLTHHYLMSALTSPLYIARPELGVR